MPDMFLRTTVYETDDLNVLATEQGLRSPRMLTLDLNYVAPNENGVKIIKPGTLIAKLASGYGRPYPAALAIAATATTSPTLTVKDASLFKVGDVIKKTSSTGTTIGTVQAIDTTAGTITLTANAAAAIAIGDALVSVESGAVTDLYGMVLSVINLTEFSNDVACYTSCSVYGQRLPYWNAAIQAQFPEITLV